VNIHRALLALVQKRNERGRWFYLLWMAGFCVVALFVIGSPAQVSDHDGFSLFLFFVAPAVVGYIQFRRPTLLGWLLLLLPTALFGVVVFCLFSFTVSTARGTGDFGWILAFSVLFTVWAVVIYLFIRHHPFARAKDAEPGASPNAGSAGAPPPSVS
jgi:hypothetical protein